jgi:hypothetical protein
MFGYDRLMQRTSLFRTCATWLSLTNLVESEAGKMRVIPTAFDQQPD